MRTTTALVFEVSESKPTLRRLVAIQIRDGSGGVMIELPVRDPVARFDVMRDARAAAELAADLARQGEMILEPRSICLQCGDTDVSDAHECTVRIGSPISAPTAPEILTGMTNPSLRCRSPRQDE